VICDAHPHDAIVARDAARPGHSDGYVRPVDQGQRSDLERERERIVGRLVSLERSFDELVAAADLGPPDDEHDPDGTTAYERAQVASLAAEARARLVAIDRTLAADVDITRCEVCGEGIGAERRAALPGTRVCVRCAAKGGLG
jgi:RNA polymerase-binding transcription factor DksA